jgi:gamma-glutamyl hydrolase
MWLDNVFSLGCRSKIVNGFLLPGGSALLRSGHDWLDTAKLMLDLALDANDRGDYFPVVAICMGFEICCALPSEATLLFCPGKTALMPYVHCH